MIEIPCQARNDGVCNFRHLEHHTRHAEHHTRHPELDSGSHKSNKRGNKHIKIKELIQLTTNLGKITN
jgi:hypothetical protein